MFFLQQNFHSRSCICLVFFSRYKLSLETINKKSQVSTVEAWRPHCERNSPGSLLCKNLFCKVCTFLLSIPPFSFKISLIYYYPRLYVIIHIVLIKDKKKGILALVTALADTNVSLDVIQVWMPLKVLFVYFFQNFYQVTFDFTIRYWLYLNPSTCCFSSLPSSCLSLKLQKHLGLKNMRLASTQTLYDALGWW